MGNRKELNIVLKNDLVLPQKRYLEIIERKSIGHPDTLADGIAESVSIDYSLYCLNNFGVILHHNFDKIYIGGGKIDVDFGRGEIIKPVILNLNGRVSKSFGDKKIDNKRILEKAAKKYISKVLPYMDIDNGLKIHFSVTDHSVKPYWFNPRDIKDIPDATEPIANDTSNCVSFWPPSPIEETTLK